MNGRLTVCRVSRQTLYTGTRRGLVCVLERGEREGQEAVGKEDETVVLNSSLHQSSMHQLITTVSHCYHGNSCFILYGGS